MSNLVCDLTNRNCKACEGGVPALGEAEAAELLKQVEGWTLEGDRISKKYTFKNYYHTMAFVNALAWISHRENHHPDLEVGWCVLPSRGSIGAKEQDGFGRNGKYEGAWISCFFDRQAHRPKPYGTVESA